MFQKWAHWQTDVCDRPQIIWYTGLAVVLYRPGNHLGGELKREVGK